ncbi:plant cysteine oxidase 1-like [Rhodamnia argentea]|uniref:cysteine dioxygenase n=1 Tax=Rhodamnia argentea TaxID=178133 RepID=A0A8B8N5G9_9MYRT|nr:plant cysteine oxidase 1-like [Rhodamnia argentea]
MRIGARLVDQGMDGTSVGHVNHSRVGYINGVIRRKRCTRRIKRHRALPFSMALQDLFLACRDIFKGPGTVPSPEDVQRLRRILDKMRPEDVGLSRDLQFSQPKSTTKGTPRVTNTTIYKCDNFSLCMFFLPSAGVIPLHNHPGMTVFSKLLLGSMHIKSYDWVDPHHLSNGSTTTSSKLKLAKVKADGVFTAPCNSSVLYPTTGGNIHAFTAITPCVILDVLGPPYSQEDDRDCSYYRDTPSSTNAALNGDMIRTKEDGERYGWLEEIDMPENSQMDSIEYLGPQVIESGH